VFRIVNGALLLFVFFVVGCLADAKGNLQDCRRCTCPTSASPQHKWMTDGLSKWCENCGIGDDA
jgi:hypothetical protein